MVSPLTERARMCRRTASSQEWIHRRVFTVTGLEVRRRVLGLASVRVEGFTKSLEL